VLETFHENWQFVSPVDVVVGLVYYSPWTKKVTSNNVIHYLYNTMYEY
jgi:hypothetical protein